ncbi:MAG: DUF6036 family nucleotidyltransferase [Myxococcota bacterium]
MNRKQFEHVIRAAGDIADDDELIVIGSQAILGAVAQAPASMLVSMEVDLYPKNHPERADLVDGSIGEGSPFHETFGYYAQGVGPETALLPVGWENRLVPVANANTRGVTGWCLELHDLFVRKCLAGREKDHRFLRDALAELDVDRALLASRLAEVDTEPERIAKARRWIHMGG